MENSMLDLVWFTRTACNHCGSEGHTFPNSLQIKETYCTKQC